MMNYSKSSDFETHRNWMAITHELPMTQWYYHGVHCLLDYPPFFAWFEYLLSWPAALVERDMVSVQKAWYASDATIIYQRTSVIVSDLLFLYGIIKFFKVIRDTEGGAFDTTRCLFNYACAGMLIIDNIHFQYNSMMYGLMILSIAYILEVIYSF